jgi:tetratricopeptide (TPR) repeat protein
MGGYAALLFGLMLNWQYVIAITPEITIGEAFSRSWTANTLRRYDVRYRSLAHLIQKNNTTQVFSIFGAYDIIDLSLLWPIANEIERGNNFKLYMVSGDHKVAVNLPVNKIIETVLRDGRLASKDIHETLAFAERPTADEIYSFAFIKRYEDEPNRSFLYDALKDLPTLHTRSWMCLYFGKSLFDCKRFKEAEDVLTNGANLDPHSHAIWHILGLTYQATGRHEEARNSYASALALRPEATTTRLRYANALAAVGEASAAESEYRLVLSQAPHLVEAQTRLVQLIELSAKTASSSSAP